MDHKIKYVRDPKDHSRVVTIAYRVTKDDRFEDSFANYGISVCSPEDSHVKSMGRRIAEGRMRNAELAGPKDIYSGKVVLHEGERVLTAVAEAILDSLTMERARASWSVQMADFPHSLERTITNFLLDRPDVFVKPARPEEEIQAQAS